MPINCPDVREDARCRVLVVDDNPQFSSVLTSFLERQPDVAIAGYARTGAEALTLADSLRPDIILLDLSLPDTSGLQLLPCLRERLPETGVIIVTLHDAPVYRQQALSAGAHGFVSKFTLFTDLLPAIRQLQHNCSKEV